MSKQAERYLEIDPWVITEKGFHPKRAKVSESVFSLANEYMGVRGYFEEGYGGETLPGSYFNGILEEEDIPHLARLNGFATRGTFMVNAVNWLYTRIEVDNEPLDIAQATITDFSRCLDMRTGTLTRTFVWTARSGKKLRLPFFFSEDYASEIKKANYEYYEPRCSHESSLSPSIHSILASELGKHQEAYRYFQQAARLDLDDYNRNTSEGLHTTSMAGAWMNIVYGFGGMRSDGNTLTFSPSLPKRWKSFGFRILYRGSVLAVRVNREHVVLSVVDGPPVTVSIYGKRRRIGQRDVCVVLPAERRAAGGDDPPRKRSGRVRRPDVARYT